MSEQITVSDADEMWDRYVYWLGREPDKDGYIFHLDGVAEGKTDEEVDDEFRRSKERRREVEQMYHELLLRPWGHWDEKAIDEKALSTKSMAQIEAEIRDSQEYKDKHNPEPNPDPGSHGWEYNRELGDGSGFSNLLPVSGLGHLLGVKDWVPDVHARIMMIHDTGYKIHNIPDMVTESISTFCWFNGKIYAATEHEGVYIKMNSDAQSWKVVFDPHKAGYGPRHTASLDLVHDQARQCMWGVTTPSGEDRPTFIFKYTDSGGWRHHKTIKDFFATSIQVRPDGMLWLGGTNPRMTSCLLYTYEPTSRTAEGKLIKSGDATFLWRSCEHDGKVYYSCRNTGGILEMESPSKYRMVYGGPSSGDYPFCDHLISHKGWLWGSFQDGYIRRFRMNESMTMCKKEHVANSHRCLRALGEFGDGLATVGSYPGQKDMRLYTRKT